MYPLGHPGNNGIVRELRYDTAGRITESTHSGNPAASTLDQCYFHDDLDRLTGFDSAHTNQGFSYDMNGNRTQARFGGNTYINLISAASNRLISTTGPAPAKLNAYDAAGNLTGDGTIHYTYGASGRMESASAGGATTSYSYNGFGQRVAKTGSATIYYVYDEQGRVLGEYDEKGAPMQETVYLGELPVAVIAPAAESNAADVYYVYADHLRTPRVITRASDNKMVWRWDQADPFGLHQPDENPGGLGVFTYNLRFPGQVFDRETNNHYNYFRDYDPQTGRYVQSDPIGLAGGINTYPYVEGNPLSKIDPLGLKSWYCQRPLGKPPGEKGPPILNHQYLCVTKADGSVSCGGLTTDGNPLSGESRLTRPDEDYYDSNSCKQVDDDNDQCFEQCVLRNFGKSNKPRYVIGPLTDCQEYADDLYYGCKMLCNARKGGK